ncbi:MAG: aminotransferase class I/II-fold pyridoxal phosphate-dependent enzyme [Deltaproteobacteria bacterium]|nr:aminotransferase class I/II-fold pyridoxal phosphate-dependent enzyme [Deltaproteobacteria bacterium]
MRQMNWKAAMADHIKNPPFESYGAFKETRPVQVDCSLGVNPLEGLYPGATMSLHSGGKDTPLDLSVYALYPRGGAQGHKTLPALVSARWPNVKTDEILFSAGSQCAMSSMGRVLGGSRVKIQGYLPCYIPGVMEFLAAGVSFEPVHNPAPDFKINVDALIAGLKDDTTIFYLDNPNNPTGNSISMAEIEKLAKACLDKGILLLSDEAYADFIDDSISALNLDLPNIICARSFSKGCGFAGLRVGYVVVKDPELCKISWDMGIAFACSGLASDVAALMLPDLDLAGARKGVKALKEKTLKFMLSHPGFSIAPTHESTPIVFLTWDRPGSLYDALMNVGIISEPGRFFDQPDSSVRLRVPSPSKFDLFCSLWEKAFKR